MKEIIPVYIEIIPAYMENHIEPINTKCRVK
jgi:hypothetical protein